MRILRNLWLAPALRLRPVSEALHLFLRSSPRLRRARWLLDSAMLLYALELLATGHLFAATVVALALAGLRSRWMASGRIEQPLSLLLTADGSLVLGYAGGRTEPVCLQRQSLALGPHLLLVLRGGGHTIRLLLGPDNLAPHDLAALKRRLPSQASRQSGLHSIAAPGSEPSTRP